MDPTERVQLGGSRVHVSRLGLGMAALGDVGRTSDNVSLAVIARTWDLGLRHVDTAAEYGLGQAERRLGAALVAHRPEGTVISTKVGRLIRPASRSYRIRHTIVESMSSRAGARVLQQKGERVARRLLGMRSTAQTLSRSPAATPRALDAAAEDLGRRPAAICAFSYDGAMRSFEESLARLGSDRVDVAFIHEPDLHQRQAARGAYRALEQLRRAGTVDAIGVAINDPEALVRFADSGDYDCFMIGGRYTLLEQPALDRLLPLAAERGISIFLGGPFNSGILADPEHGLYDYTRPGKPFIEKARHLSAVCNRHGVSIKAAALQFPLAHPAVVSVLVGAATVAEIEEDVMLMGQPIPTALWDELRHEGLLAVGVPTPA